MANNVEIAWITAAQKIGRSMRAGSDPSRQHEIAHRFYTSNEDVEFRKALEARGFRVSARDDSPGFEARRPDYLSAIALKPVIEELCRVADKYSAEYDGWELVERDDEDAGDG